MKDERVVFFRKALEGLIESLDATVRVTRWDAGDAIPEPLQDSARQLVDRLGTAGRLLTGTFKGTTADTARVDAMQEAMRRLDAAYVAYRYRLETKPTERGPAALALHEEIDDVKAGSRRWA